MVLGKSVIDPLASPLSAPQTPSVIFPVELSPVAVTPTPPADISTSDLVASECSILHLQVRLVHWLLLVGPLFPSCSDESRVTFAAGVHLPASPLLPPGLPLSQPGSPSLVSSCCSDDPLTTPSFHLGSVRSPSSSEASFYALSLAPSFQEGGSDHYFSDGDGAPSPIALSDVSASVEQPGVLAIQDADQAPVGPSL